MKNNNKVLCFSGASHSGKTSFINSITNDKIISYTELIREKKKINIDKLRKNPKKYLEYQFEIISEKINQELTCISKYNNKIIIFDRSLIDSLYYYLIYFNKTLFNKSILQKYENFLSILLSTIQEHFIKYIDYIILFKPIINIVEKDLFRPKYLQLIQENEFSIIKALTYHYMDITKIKEINIQKENVQLKEFIYGLIK